MKNNHVLLVLISILFSLILSSCNNSTDITPISINIDESTVLDQYDPDSFDLSDISLIIFYDNGTSTITQLSESMISEEDLILLSSLGYQELQVQYLDLTTTLSIRFVYDDLKTKLKLVHQLALTTQDVPETYEEWLESISGEDGLSITEVNLNSLGHLILTFSDSTTQDVGRVVGDDGKEVELQTTSTTIEWRYTDDLVWQELIQLTEITGIGIAQIEINNEGELIVTYTDDQTTNLGVFLAHMVKFIDPFGRLIDIVWVPNNQDALAPNPPELTGYTFSEWDGVFATVNSDLIINAIYIQNSYDVNFVSDTTTEYPVVSDVYYGNTIDLPAPEKLNFIFIGWFTDPNATLPWDFTVDKVVEDSIVLYAGWDPSLFNIIYDLNGGDLPLTYPVDFYAGENKVLPLPTKAGFSFVAWYPYDWVDSSSTRAGDPGYQSLPAETYEDLYVYAHWDPVSVRVTFRANYPIEDEGPENPTTKMVNYGDPINFDTLADTAEYEFVGWNSSPSGTGTFYNNDDLFIRTQRITVYAIWLLIE